MEQNPRFTWQNRNHSLTLQSVVHEPQEIVGRRQVLTKENLSDHNWNKYTLLTHLFNRQRLWGPNEERGATENNHKTIPPAQGTSHKLKETTSTSRGISEWQWTVCTFKKEATGITRHLVERLYNRSLQMASWLPDEPSNELKAMSTNWPTKSHNRRSRAAFTQEKEGSEKEVMLKRIHRRAWWRSMEKAVPTDTKKDQTRA